MSTDAIVVLREEHREIKRLFRRFERTEEQAEQQDLVGRMIEMLKSHTRIENEVLYPRVRKLVRDLTDDILESYEEHHVADLLMAELADAGDPGLGGSMTELRDERTDDGELPGHATGPRMPGGRTSSATSASTG